MEATGKNRENGLQELLNTFEQHRDSLIPILQGVQGNFGYISEESVESIARYLSISQGEIFGVATFYSQFRFTRPGENTLRICQGTACHVNGAPQIIDEVGRVLGISAGETTPDYKFSTERVACFGSCALAPVIVVNDKVFGRITPKKVKKILKEFE